MTAPFIEHSSATWNFQSDRMLDPLSDAPSDLSNETPPNKTCPTRLAQPDLPNEKGEAMRKTLMALAAVATLAVSAVTAPAPAHAQRYLGAAIAGGLIGGAIVGAAAAPYYYGYGPGYYRPYGYYGGPAYVAAPGYYGGGCVWQRQRFWDGYGWRFRNVRVCG
jgi:hypothetical protein